MEHLIQCKHPPICLMCTVYFKTHHSIAFCIVNMPVCNPIKYTCNDSSDRSYKKQRNQKRSNTMCTIMLLSTFTTIIILLKVALQALNTYIHYGMFP